MSDLDASEWGHNETGAKSEKITREKFSKSNKKHYLNFFLKISKKMHYSNGELRLKCFQSTEWELTLKEL